MNTVMVDYDLITPGQKYKQIEEYVKAHSWAHPLKSTWLIRTNKSATAVRDDLMRIIDSNDKLLVSDVTRSEMAWTGLPKDVSDWILNSSALTNPLFG